MQETFNNRQSRFKQSKSSKLLKLRDLDATLIRLDARRINHSEPHQQVATPLHAKRIHHTPMRVAAVVMRVASRASRADSKGPIKAQNWSTRFRKPINRPHLLPEREFRNLKIQNLKILGVWCKKKKKEWRFLLDCFIRFYHDLPSYLFFYYDAWVDLSCF